ncbi:hypothetical protein PRUPE_4G273500 [Prunus persica]|uniref:WAT1-related protein n=1 Tax=Prunus persica TaxID=3760 RepID=A0A251PRT5_PRUPE|nr:WAT1-related protein At4g08300 [Prunus persica]ONI14294.1 hypothetical protein PRUPE_4G273500 [Prunus persica]
MEGQQQVMVVEEIVEEGEQHELAIEQQPANVVMNSNEEEAQGQWGKIKKVAPFIIGMLIPMLIGGNSIFTKRGLKEGMSFSVFLFYKNTLASIVLLVATLITRTPWPKMTRWLVIRIIALSVLEPVLSQIAIFSGLKFTPASFSSCLIATGPALTLVASWILQLEHIAISERRSQAKLLGMVMVITGGLVVGLYNGPTITVLQPSHISGQNVVSHRLTENWIRGPLLVSFSVLFSVLYNILMEMTTKKTDASPLFLTASICTLGALMNLIVAVAMESGSGFVWIVGLNTKLVCYLYSGIVVSGFTSFLQSMLLRERGAVFLTSFSPLSTIFVMMVGAIVLKEVIHVGSILGALIIVTGLFILQWGKLKASASEDG